jgi:hypothetical protein
MSLPPLGSSLRWEHFQNDEPNPRDDPVPGLPRGGPGHRGQPSLLQRPHLGEPIISAVLAVLLWPLVLFGVDLHIK